MRRAARGLVWIGAVMGGFLAVAVLAVQLMTRTGFGMERARRFAAGWLAGRVTGSASLGRISGDGLLAGVTVHQVEIRGADGRDFLSADSLKARYDWLQLLRGRVAIDNVELFGGTVRIERLPGDSLWNYQRVFASDGGGGGPRRTVRFADVRLHGTSVTVGLPDEGRGPTRFVTEEAGDGRLRVLRFADLEGWLGPVSWESPAEPGRRIRIRSLSGVARILEQPVRIVDVEGNVAIRDSVVSLDLDLVELPGSRFEVTGRVIQGANGPRFDLRNGGRIELADFSWLHPRTPQGEAELDMRIETLADGGLSLRSERFEYRAPGAEIDGAFGWVVAATPALRGVDLRVARADVAWLDSILPVTLKVAGGISGTVRADGPLDGIRTSGELRLRRAGRERVAQASWSGVLALRPGIEARALEAEVRDVDLDLVDMLRPGLGLAGPVDGRITLDGPLGTGMDVRAVLAHRHATGTSTLDGVVTVTAGDSGATASGRFLVDPLRLETLADLAPQLSWLQGPVRGAVAFDTRLDSVRVGADLGVGEGRAEFGVVADLGPVRPVLDGSVTVSGFAPAGIGAPTIAEQVSGEATFRLVPGNLSALSGSVRIDLDSATVNGFPTERSAAFVRIRDGTLILDSATARAPGLVGRGRGTIGLIGDRRGVLIAELGSESLEPLEAFFLGGIEDPTQPRLGGTLAATATVRGSIEGFDLDGDVTIERLAWADRSAARIEAGLEATGLRTDTAAWRLRARGETVLALGTVSDSLRLDVDFARRRARVLVDAWADAQRGARLAGTWSLAAGAEPATFDLDSLALGSAAGRWLLRDPARITLGDGSAGFRDLALVADSGGMARVSGRIALADPERPGTRPLDFTFDVADVAFATLPSRLRPIGEVTGTVNGRLALTGTATEPVMDASFDVTDVAYLGATLARLTGEFRYRDRRLETRLTAAADRAGVRAVLSGGGDLPVDLRLGSVERRVLDGPIDMTVQLDSLPAAFAFGLVPGFTNISGAFEGRIRASGPARGPRLSGTMALVDGAATWEATGVRYVEAEGTFLMQENMETRIDVTARTVDSRGRDPIGGRRGTARVTGTLDLSRASDPGFDLVLEAQRMLATRRREAEVVMSGRATLGGRYRRPRVSGSMRVEGGSLYLDEVYRQYLIVGLEDPLFFDVVDTSLVSVRRVLPPTENPFLRGLLIEDTQLAVASGSWLRSREMDVEVQGSLNVDFDRQAGDLRMQGTLSALRGSYRLEYPPFARIFEVREGEVDFPGTPGIDPSLSIRASYRARTAGGEPLDIYAVVSGTLQAPRVHLESDIQPPISESDLASYLFFGAPTSAFNLGADVSGETGLFGGLGSRALAASGLGYFASGLQTLAQSFGLVDYVGLTAAEAAGPGTAGLGGVFASTRIELGRYLTSDLFVAYTQRLTSDNRGAGVRLEWRLTPTYKLDLFAEDRFARAPSFSLSQLISARKEYGFFLFREWGY